MAPSLHLPIVTPLSSVPYFFLLLTLAMTLPAGCRHSRCCMSWPDAVPSDLSIRMTSSGGMLPQWETVVIFNDSITIDRYFEGAESSLNAPIERTALGPIWESLLKHKFESLETRFEEVYDRGGVAVEVARGDDSCRVSDAGQSFVVERDAERWTAIVQSIQEIREQVTNAHGIPTTFVLDSSIRGHRVSLTIGWNSVLSDSLLTSFERNAMVVETVLPGTHIISVTVDLDQWGRQTADIRMPCTYLISLNEGVLSLRRL